jgi:hypothetical protein
MTMDAQAWPKHVTESSERIRPDSRLQACWDVSRGCSPWTVPSPVGCQVPSSRDQSNLTSYGRCSEVSIQRNAWLVAGGGGGGTAKGLMA